MAADAVLVRRLEELGFNAWPALRTLLVGGWVVRLADGYNRRANGASPMHPTFLSPREVIDRVDSVFERAGIAPVYRLTGLQAPGFEKALRERGYVDFEPFVVLRSDLLRPAEDDPEVAISQSLSDHWLYGALAAHGWQDPVEDGLRRVFSDIVWPCGFATVCRDGRDLAWGLAVHEGEHVGLFDLVVAPEFRGQGLGRKLVVALLDWGRRRGARHAYLQVRTDNEVARRLYSGLHFKEVYRCTHFARQHSGA